MERRLTLSRLQSPPRLLRRMVFPSPAPSLPCHLLGCILLPQILLAHRLPCPISLLWAHLPPSPNAGLPWFPPTPAPAWLRRLTAPPTPGSLPAAAEDNELVVLLRLEVELNDEIRRVTAEIAFYVELKRLLYPRGSNRRFSG